MLWKMAAGWFTSWNRNHWLGDSGPVGAELYNASGQQSFLQMGHYQPSGKLYSTCCKAERRCIHNSTRPILFHFSTFLQRCKENQIDRWSKMGNRLKRLRIPQCISKSWRLCSVCPWDGAPRQDESRIELNDSRISDLPFWIWEHTVSIRIHGVQSHCKDRMIEMGLVEWVAWQGQSSLSHWASLLISGLWALKYRLALLVCSREAVGKSLCALRPWVTQAVYVLGSPTGEARRATSGTS